MTRVARIALLLLMTLLPTVQPAAAVHPAKAKVQVSRSTVRVRTKAAVAEVRRTPFRLEVRAGDKTLVREQTGGLCYERGGAVHGLGNVRNVRRVDDGAELDVETDEGQVATVTLRFLTRRTLEVTVVPPDTAGVTAIGERLRSPATERIYGLTE